jgi:hypothetical protein
MSLPPTVDAPEADAVPAPAEEPTTSFLRSLWARHREIAIFTTVLGLLTWPPAVRATVGLDPSWQIALHLAARNGMQAGKDIVFTYGPLGFLVVRSMVLPSTGMLAVLVNAAVNFVAIAMVFAILRRQLALRVTVIATVALYFTTLYPVMQIFSLAVVTLVLFALWAGTAVTSVAKVPHLVYRAVGIGVLVALAMLVKLDSGIGCLALAAFATAWRAGLRQGVRSVVTTMTGFVGGLIGAFLLGWVATGQSLGNLSEYLRLSVSVIQGYSLGMGLEVAGTSWQYPIALAVVGGLIWGAAKMATKYPARRIGLILVVLQASAITFKQGFVRHDAGHVVGFLLLGAIFPILFLAWLGRDRTIVLCVLGIVGLTASLSINIGEEFTPSSLFGGRFPTFVHFALSGSARATKVADQQRDMRALYAVPPEILDKIEGHTVNVEPWETGVVYAYPAIRWDPAPVFQDYAAYTSVLDRLNAKFMAGTRAPEFVLRQPWAAIDARVPRWESPDEQLQLLCNYRQVSLTPTWQLLQRTPNRCGTGKVIERRTVKLGVQTPTPAPREPNALVVSRIFGVGDSFAEKVQTLAFRGSFFWAQGATPPWSRFLQGHQDDLHVLTGPACAITQMDGRVPYDFSRLTISDRQEQHAGSASIHLEYVEIPFRC